MDTHFNWNLNHYRMKWGGDAGGERFATPYDRKDVDHRWWPDPGRSIQVRDWDEGNARFTEMLWALVRGRREASNRRIVQSMEGRTVEFGRCVGAPLGRITFGKDVVLNAGHENESRWRAAGDELWLEDPRGAPTTAFDTILFGREKRWLIGPSLISVRQHYVGPLPDDAFTKNSESL